MDVPKSSKYLWKKNQLNTPLVLWSLYRTDKIRGSVYDDMYIAPWYRFHSLVTLIRSQGPRNKTNCKWDDYFCKYYPLNHKNHLAYLFSCMILVNLMSMAVLDRILRILFTPRARAWGLSPLVYACKIFSPRVHACKSFCTVCVRARMKVLKDWGRLFSFDVLFVYTSVCRFEYNNEHYNVLPRIIPIRCDYLATEHDMGTPSCLLITPQLAPLANAPKQFNSVRNVRQIVACRTVSNWILLWNW